MYSTRMQWLLMDKSSNMAETLFSEPLDGVTGLSDDHSLFEMISMDTVFIGS